MELTDAEIRRRLLAAGRHLTPTRFGWVVSQIATPGINWARCSKGSQIEAVADHLMGRGEKVRPDRLRDFTLAQLEEALRAQA